VAGADPTAQIELVATEEHPIGLPTRVLDVLRDLWAQALSLAVSLGGAWAERAIAGARALVRPRLMRQAVAAAGRGNLDAAFALLREEVAERPGAPKSTLLFWGVALSCNRAAEAAAPLARLVRDEAAAGRVVHALDQWLALVAEVPGAVLDVNTLARLVPELRKRYSAARGEKAQQAAREILVDTLQRCVDPASGALTPAIALRLVEEARGLDADVARRAAKAALASPGLHETKRARLTELLRTLDDGRWPEAPVAPPAPQPAPVAPRAAAPPTARPVQRAVQPAPAPPSAEPARPAPQSAPVPFRGPTMVAPTAAPAPAPRIAPQAAPPIFAAAPSNGALRAVEIKPVELAEDGLVAWEIENAQRTRVNYRAIEAIASAEVAGLADEGVIVVDLVLRTTRPGRPRGTLRMRADAFDPATLFPDRTDAGQALRALLSELLDRSGALPLPDPDSALAVRPQRFESLAAFEAATLARLPG
jgi:hypothetical protein